MAMLHIKDVLSAEAEAIHDKTPGRELYQSLNKLESSALCLSGGGIRSAAFGLGVIQALAAHPRSTKGEPVDKAEASLLAQFHYLSTVSGGGYIGSWLSAGIARLSFPKVWEGLNKHGPDGEPAEISWLRRNTNYLTPKLGLASPDSWAGVVIYLRNLMLNWLIIIPALCAALLLLKLLAIAFFWFSEIPPVYAEALSYLAIPAALCLFVGLNFRTRKRPTRTDARTTRHKFLLFDLLPTGLAAVLLSFASVSSATYSYVRSIPECTSEVNLASLGCLGSLATNGAIAGVILYAAAWILAFPKFRSWLDRIGDFVAWTIAGTIYGILLATGLFLYSQIQDDTFWLLESSLVVALILGVPWILLSQLLGEIVFVGLTSWEEGSDLDREWFGRTAGYYLVMAILWLGVAAFTLVGMDLAWLLYDSSEAWLASIGGLSGLVTWIVGKSRYSTASGESKTKKQFSANIILVIAAPIFIAVLLIVFSAVLDRALLGRSLALSGRVSADLPASPTDLQPILWAFVAAVSFSFWVALFVNINRFSLHAVYRNRLVRTFLGASNASRDATRIPDFDDTDNPPMKDLWPRSGEARPRTSSRSWRPFHIVNVALNVLATKNLAWQERKAEPFSISPLYSGFGRDAYRASSEYGHKERGISLGTAMAISGAAVSPNMGYHSSPTITLLLTLFNIRLGWWLGNPGNEGERTYAKEGPTSALIPLYYEAFGLTSDDRKYIYLSDGGHFENLGLYEMVRRRCRFIVISDAGCDADFTFEDLGNAIRKIAIDLCIPITFSSLQNLRPRPKGDNAAQEAPYFAIGTVDYAAADGAGTAGIILYIKPSYHGTEKNAGVRAYALNNKTFPHEGTGDQWFSESQFESYRALGFEITDDVLHSAIRRLNTGLKPTLANLIETLAEEA